MTLDQLRIFIAVAERQNMTSAADALGITQSAVSASIAAVERQYEIKLFDRIGRRISLTAEGEALVSTAAPLLAGAAEIDQLLHDMKRLKRGALRIRASQTAGNYWLPKFLVDFRRSYPDVALDLGVGNTRQVAAAIEEGLADLGFVEGEVANENLTVEIVARDRIAVVVSDGHPWVSRKKLQPQDMLDVQWVLREKGSGTRSALETGLTQVNVDIAQLDIAMELPTNESVRAALIAGSYAGALSTSVTVVALEAGQLHTVDFNLPDRHFYAVTHKHRKLSRTAEAFLQMLSCRRHH